MDERLKSETLEKPGHFQTFPDISIGLSLLQSRL